MAQSPYDLQPSTDLAAATKTLKHRTLKLPENN